MEVPLLEEHEWAKIEPHLRNAIGEIKQYRETHRVSLAEAKNVALGKEALEMYYEMTGFRETNINALWHHRLSMFGNPCEKCGKPLRTPKAKLCAECNASAV